MSKATELPINVLVIIVLAVIILLSMIAMYLTGFGPFSKTVSLEGVRGDACRRLVQETRCAVATKEISIDNFDANRDDSINGGNTWDWIGATQANRCGTTADPTKSSDNLASLCFCDYSLTTENACRSLCGCGGSSGGGGGGGPCVPNCAGKVCGSDGCSGTCPPGCPIGQNCNAVGQCIVPACTCSWQSVIIPSPGCLAPLGLQPGQCILFVVGIPRVGVTATCVANINPCACTCTNSLGVPVNQGNNGCICGDTGLCAVPTC